MAPERSQGVSMSIDQAAGYPTVSAYLMVDGAQRVIDFVTQVLGGEVIMRMNRDDGSLRHGSLRIGDSVIMLADATKDFPAFPVWLHVYVPDVDATYRQGAGERRRILAGALRAGRRRPSRRRDGSGRKHLVDRNPCRPLTGSVAEVCVQERSDEADTRMWAQSRR